MFRLVIGGPIVDLDPEWVVQHAVTGASLTGLERDVEILGEAVKVVLGLSLVALVIAPVVKLRDLLAGNPLDARL